jgi:hypothetical protein
MGVGLCIKSLVNGYLLLMVLVYSNPNPIPTLIQGDLGAGAIVELG